MNLSDEQLTKLKALLKRRLTRPVRCAGCTEQPEWKVGAVKALVDLDWWLEHQHSQREPNLPFDHQTTPLISVACSGCGFTMLYDATILGVVSEQTGRILL